LTTEVDRHVSSAGATAAEILKNLGSDNVGREQVTNDLLDLYNASSDSSTARQLIIAGLNELPGKHLVPIGWWQSLLEVLVDPESEGILQSAESS
jgi:hypothetical protein